MITGTDLRQASVANLVVGQTDPVGFVEDAAAAGFGAVGLLLRSATGAMLQHEIVGRPEVIRAIRAALRATGLHVFDVEAFILGPGADMDGFRRALAAGAELGATHISSIGTEWIGRDDLLQPAERIALFGRLCDEAARFGLHVGVEFMLYRDIRTWQEALALVESAGRPNAGLIMDFLHLQRAGATPAEIATIPAQRIAYVQICDCGPEAPAVADLPKEARGARRHLGEGIVPLDALLDALPDGRQLVIETPVAAEAGWTRLERLRSSAGHARRFLGARAARQHHGTR
jgi:sugar phosphate isomerase/epimerase